MMKAYGTAEDKSGDDLLTEKQRRVLDLLLENKTSKEIARTLGISPYTVDQRISLARGKLGVSSRTELAARYRAMRAGSDQSGYDSLPAPADTPEHSPNEKPASPDIVFLNVWSPSGPEYPLTGPTAPGTFSFGKKSCPTDTKLDHRVGPRVFEGSSGALWRISAIVVTALLLVMTILGLFAIFDQLNEMLA